MLAPAHPVGTEHQDERDQTEYKRGAVGPDILAVVERAEDIECGSFGAALNATANHQNRAKFAQRARR